MQKKVRRFFTLDSKWKGSWMAGEVKEIVEAVTLPYCKDDGWRHNMTVFLHVCLKPVCKLQQNTIMKWRIKLMHCHATRFFSWLTWLHDTHVLIPHSTSWWKKSWIIKSFINKLDYPWPWLSKHFFMVLTVWEIEVGLKTEVTQIFLIDRLYTTYQHYTCISTRFW